MVPLPDRRASSRALFQMGRKLDRRSRPPFGPTKTPLSGPARQPLRVPTQLGRDLAGEGDQPSPGTRLRLILEQLPTVHLHQ
jgi:hypothetical protein